MVRTGRRAEMLRDLLEEAGFEPLSSTPPAPRLERLPVGLADEIGSLYAVLGGRGDVFQLRPGAWDLAFRGLVVELDEELHFNRYRRTTLEPEWTATLPWRDTYRELCTSREADCLAAGRWGKRWTNPSCEARFGPGDRPGALEGAGSPRWKQRALYDAVKDAYCLGFGDTRLARLSTHDLIGTVTLGAVIDRRAVIDLHKLRSFAEERAAPRVASG